MRSALIYDIYDMERLRLIKKLTKNKLKKDFDSYYDKVKKIAIEDFNYNGMIKVISDNKYVNFYLIEEDDQ